MKRRTLEEFIAQRACNWWVTRRDLLGSDAANKEVARFAHKEARDRLSEAVELFMGEGNKS